MKKICMFLIIFLTLSASLFSETYKLYGYDGSRYSIYLGKFGYSINKFTNEVSDYDSESVFNEYGQYGSEYRDTIWNQYRDYGSKYRDTSCMNSYAQHPPAIVDRQGKTAGYLTANKYMNNTNLGKSISRSFRMQ
jgi:hypothetical protein